MTHEVLTYTDRFVLGLIAGALGAVALVQALAALCVWIDNRRKGLE